MPQRAAENLGAMMSWCFHAPSDAFDRDSELRMTREQQQQRTKRPWFFSGSMMLPDKLTSGNASRQRLASMDTPTEDSISPVTPARTAIVPMNALPPRWIHDENVLNCIGCDHAFDLLVRKHHCRACGRVFCASCTSHSIPVIKFGFPDPVRVCRTCTDDATLENVLYQVHLPLLEQGHLFLKRGLLRRRVVELKMIRSLLIFQYQTIDPELQIATGELKAFPLDAITDVRLNDAPSSNSNSSGRVQALQSHGFSIIVGNEEHRFDAASFELRNDWLVAIQSLREVRNAQRSRALDREKQHQQQQQQQEQVEMRQMALSLQQREERQASFVQERLRKRAELRESLRAKYNLGSTSMNGTTSAS